jgi:hypothetical protein
MKIIKYLRQHIWLTFVRMGLTNVLSDQGFAKYLHLFFLGRKLRTNPPVDFNEKLQWLKIHYRHPMMPVCADKYGVREYVKEKIGAQYLNKCINVYDNVEDIDFDVLPQRFVLKCTHGSSWNIVCYDKNKLDKKDTSFAQ